FVFYGYVPMVFPVNFRKWVILRFRGRLRVLLLLTNFGVSPRPHLPKDKVVYGSDTSHAEKAGSFSRSLAYSICWDRLSFTASFFIRVNSINALTYSSSEALHR